MNGWILALYFYLAAISLWLVVIDLRHHRLPNYLTLGSYPVVATLLTGAAATSPRGFESLGRAGLAALAVLGLFAILHLIKPTGLGLGDVKFSPIIGAVLGWHSWAAVVTGLVSGFVLAGVTAGILLLLKRVKPKDEIAFGPYLIAGLWLATLQIG